MLKVFIVEDDAVVREDLIDIIPWEQYGYTFIGCATDGEMALPEISTAESRCTYHRYTDAIYGRCCPEQTGTKRDAPNQNHHYQRLQQL